MGMILRIASSRIVGQGDIVGRSGYFRLNLSANSVMRGRLDARRTLKSLVADLRIYMNGTVSRLKAGNKKAIEPGCEIIVPSKEQKKKMTTAEILGMGSTTASIAAMIATMVNLFK